MTHLPIRLEPFTEADFDRLIGWVPSSAFLLQWAGAAFDYPLTAEQLRRHLAAGAGDPPSQRIYRAVDVATGAVVGHAELGQIDRRHGLGRACRILVGAPEARGRGCGEAIMRALLAVAFDELRLHRVELAVFDFNTAGIACYEKVGFCREGFLREARRHEEGYWNIVVMGILEQDYRSTQNPQSER